MRKNAFLIDDPVVREVREARAKLWKEGGGTIAGFIRVVKQRTARKRRRGTGARRKGSKVAKAGGRGR